MDLKPGQKLHSAVCDAQFVVVRAPKEPVELGCGGAPLLADGEEAPAGAALDDTIGEPVLIGKRYADDELGLELLCSRGGAGAVTLDGVPLPLKGAKPLPASD